MKRPCTSPIARLRRAAEISLLGFLPAGDVADRSRHADRGVLLVPDRLPADVEPTERAVLGPDAALDVEVAPMEEVLPQRVHHPLPVLGVEARLEVQEAIAELPLLESEELLEAG